MKCSPEAHDRNLVFNLILWALSVNKHRTIIYHQNQEIINFPLAQVIQGFVLSTHFSISFRYSSLELNFSKMMNWINARGSRNVVRDGYFHLQVSLMKVLLAF